MAEMSGSQFFRDLISEQLNVAAAEIFRAIEKTINNYEEELEHLRKVLKTVRKSQNVPQQQGLIDEERVSRLDHVEPESFHIKEDVDEIVIGQEEEQFVLKQEAGTSDNGESGQIEAELGGDHRLLSHSSLVAESQDQTGSEDVGKDIFNAKEDVDYHQGVSDLIWQPKIKLHRIEQPQLHPSEKEDVPTDHQLCEQQENRNHQKIRIRQKSLSHVGKTIVLTSHNEESDHMETETDSDHQLLSPGAEITLSDCGSLSETQSKKCKIFGKSFSKRTEFRLHPKSHTHEKPYSCETCGKCFVDDSSLQVHMRSHTTKKTVVCNICNKAFRGKSNLVAHMRTHTGEKPYICNICNTSYAWKTDLESHIRTHTGEKPYFCEMCGKCFTRNGTLKHHMRIHTGEKPFNCNICNKPFRSKSQLAGHIKIHTGEKPFICDICNRCFSRKNHLKGHMRTHTGEKPFSCEICGKCFAQRGTAKQHMESHAAQTPIVQVLLTE